MKVIKALAVIVITFVALLGGVSLYVTSYMRTAEFKQEVLTRARAAMGSNVEIDRIDISLFGGVRLEKVVITNPQGFPGNFLTAEEIMLHPQLLPLLLKRVEIEHLSLINPVLVLVSNRHNVWNFQKIGARSPEPGPATSQGDDEALSAEPAFAIELSNLSVEDGEVKVLDGRKNLLTRLQELDITTTLSSEGDELTGSGEVSVETLNVGDVLYLRQLNAPLRISSNQVRLEPLTGKLAGGHVSGNVTLTLGPPFKYALNLQVDGADVSTLQQEAGAKRTMTGKLQATTALEGTGGLPKMTGRGRANIVRGKLVQAPMQKMLAALLQAPSLQEIRFDECVAEFSLARNALRTPLVRLTSPALRLTGKGVLSLATKSLDHQVTLALKKGAVVVPKPILPAFTETADGFLTLKFHLWGPYESPKTDLKRRLITSSARQLLDKSIRQGLKKLFK